MALLLSSTYSQNVYSSNEANKSCDIKIDSDDIEVHWTGYKFPTERKGVKGTLRNLGLKDNYKGKSLKSILTGMSFNIDGRSVWSRNSRRDARIVKYFFGKMISGTHIKGKVLEYSKDSLTMLLNMNGMAKEVTLKVTNQENKMTAKGNIDVLEWGMSKSLNAINKECSSLHKGKTWSDVDIKLTLTYEKDC